jgi:hypothetical protein
MCPIRIAMFFIPCPSYIFCARMQAPYQTAYNSHHRQATHTMPNGLQLTPNDQMTKAFLVQPRAATTRRRDMELQSCVTANTETLIMIQLHDATYQRTAHAYAPRRSHSIGLRMSFYTNTMLHDTEFVE